MPERRAIGVLETRGMAALTAAADAMLKAANVSLCGRHGIGSGWVTAVVEGEVAAVQTAIRVGQETGKQYGELIIAQVIPGPESGMLKTMPHSAALRETPVRTGALGMLETQGLTQLIVGADAMAKAADVEIAGWAFIGGALCHVSVRGEVEAVRTAVEAGRKAAEAVGTVYATLTLPRPIEGIGGLFPPPLAGKPERVAALGILETTGYVACVGGSDAMVKRADVEVVRLSIASGGRIVALVKGALDAVTAAVESGAATAKQVGVLNAAQVISQPEPQVIACFGVGAGLRPASTKAGTAMGLIETRSTVGLVKAMDAMLKAANVEYEGSYKVGYFLTASVIRGDVSAVRVALDAGGREASKHGELVATHLIPYPYAELEERLSHR